MSRKNTMCIVDKHRHNGDRLIIQIALPWTKCRYSHCGVINVIKGDEYIGWLEIDQCTEAWRGSEISAWVVGSLKLQPWDLRQKPTKDTPLFPKRHDWDRVSLFLFYKQQYVDVDNSQIISKETWIFHNQCFTNNLFECCGIKVFSSVMLHL